jgi:hypothetical protein
LKSVLSRVRSANVVPAGSANAIPLASFAVLESVRSDTSFTSVPSFVAPPNSEAEMVVALAVAAAASRPPATIRSTIIRFIRSISFPPGVKKRGSPGRCEERLEAVKNA